MASDIWLRTILIVRKETRCRHIGYTYRLTARVLLYAPSHRQDNTYHGLCYTSCVALAGTRNFQKACSTIQQRPKYNSTTCWYAIRNRGQTYSQTVFDSCKKSMLLTLTINHNLNLMAVFNRLPVSVEYRMLFVAGKSRALRSSPDSNNHVAWEFSGPAMMFMSGLGCSALSANYRPFRHFLQQKVS